MRLPITPLVLAALSLAASGCDPSSVSASAASGSEATESVDQKSSDQADRFFDPTQHAAQQQRLSAGLAAIDAFAERLWPGDGGEAGLNWLRNSAAGSGLELTQVTPQDVIEHPGVAVRPATLRAEGQWADVVAWLQAVEASPRRLVLRDVAWRSQQNHVVTDLKVAVLMDRPAEQAPPAETDVAKLRGQQLDQAVQRAEAELESKHQALNELGANASWSRPIAAISELMPQSARPMKLSLALTDHGQRAQAFEGTFTLAVSDAGQVPGYVRGLQKRPGFAAAGLESLRRAGAGWQRAVVTFTFTDAARPALLPRDVSSVAEVAVVNP